MTEKELTDYIEALQSQRWVIARDGAKNVSFRGRGLGRFTLDELDKALGRARSELSQLLRYKDGNHPLVMSSPIVTEGTFVPEPHVETLEIHWH